MSPIVSKILVMFGLQSINGPQRGTEVIQLSRDMLSSLQKDNSFNRNTYRMLINLAIMQSIIILLMIGTNCWLVIRAHPIDRFFIAAVDGRITPIMPLDTPIMDNNEVFSRTANAIASAMTFGFLDMEQRRNEMGQSFSPQALNKIQDALIGSGGMKAMMQDGRYFGAEVNKSGPGAILQQSVNPANIYEWLVQVRVIVTATSGFGPDTKSEATPMVVTAMVRRAKEIELQRGYIIDSINSIVAEGPPKPVAVAPIVITSPEGGAP